MSDSKPAYPGIVRPGLKLQAIGITMIVVSTLCIAIVPTFAKLAYDDGSNTLSIITGRGIVSILFTFPLMIALRQPLRIGRKPLAISIVMGVLYAAMLYCYLGAVQYLAVNLVILIYFIHPLLVGFIVVGLGAERLRLTSLVALVVALVGLGLAIGFSFQALDSTGLTLAALAMAVTAVIIVGNSRAMRDASALSVAFYMMLSAAVSLVVIFPFSATLALPTTAMGWTGFAGVAFAATAGTLTFCYGMGLIGAARAAMISNLEPVLGILFALAILGERLTLLQGVGITLVLAAIVAMEMRR
jgi:drug/metabolite transporter (DMT)-like permease